MAHPAPPEAGASGADFPDLIQACPELREASRVVVAYSGGLDSTVLLYLLHEAHAQGALTAAVHAIHINHALQPDANRWQEHCQQACAGLGVPLHTKQVQVVPAPGESLEECARNARHAVFESTLQPGEVLALAHHRDDQVETVLFRLLRGSGVAGLAGMPRSRTCGNGRLFRPLLGCSHADLLTYAQARRLVWIEDSSNQDQRFDRNFLRGAVLPLLLQRWPGLARAVERSAQLSREAAYLLDILAASDFVAAAGPQSGQLRIEALLMHDDVRQRNLLRYWLARLHTEHGFAAPTHQVLQRIVSDVLQAVPDAEPLLSWGNGANAVELRRHRNLLHVLAPLPALTETLLWRTDHRLNLPNPLGSLALQVVSGAGLPCDRLAEVHVRFRSGGEQVKAAGRPTRPLKKILQDAGIPPWLRDRIPLLYVRDELVAVADLLICEGWLSETAGNTCQIVWLHPDLDCGHQPHLLT